MDTSVKMWGKNHWKCLIWIFVPKIASLEPFLLQLKTVLITVISELANTIVFNNNEKLILGAKIKTQINETFLRDFQTLCRLKM